jgi:hypothetical protein
VSARAQATLLALTLLLLAAPVHAQWTTGPAGRTLVTRMRTAPFPHRSRPQYTNDQTLLVVPPGFTPGPTVDIIVHYHGHRAEAVSSAQQRRLAEQLRDSGVNAVLLAPQGPLRANDSAGGQHGEEGGLQRFVEEALARLIRDGVVPPGTRPGRIILSGHSGAYLVISQALDRGGLAVSEVWLHDGLYGQVGAFQRWAQRPGRRLITTHTAGGGTRNNNNQLARDLRAAGVPVATSLGRHRGRAGGRDRAARHPRPGHRPLRGLRAHEQHAAPGCRRARPRSRAPPPPPGWPAW